jgi:hypothetical protein
VHRPGSQTWYTIPYTELYTKLRAEEDFPVHKAVAAALGIRLDVRRARPQWNRKHIRVRPRFDHWRVVCDLTMTDDVLTEALVLQILTLAGKYKGVGNWRPSNPIPGRMAPSPSPPRWRNTERSSMMDTLTGWYMARIDGKNFTAFKAENDEDADRKIQSLREASSDPTATFSWVTLRDDLQAYARTSGLPFPD